MQDSFLTTNAYDQDTWSTPQYFAPYQDENSQHGAVSSRAFGVFRQAFLFTPEPGGGATLLITDDDLVFNEQSGHLRQTPQLEAQGCRKDNQYLIHLGDN